MDRYRQRRPHALMSLRCLAQLLKVAFDLKHLVLGLSSPNKLPEKIEYDYELTDLKRAYGHKTGPVKPPPPAVGVAQIPLSQTMSGS